MRVSVTFAHPLTRLILGSNQQLKKNQLPQPLWGLTGFARQAGKVFNGTAASVGFLPQNTPMVGAADQFMSQKIKPAVIYHGELEPVIADFSPPRPFLTECLHRSGIRQLTIRGPASGRDVADLLRTVLRIQPDVIKNDIEVDNGIEYLEEKLPVEIAMPAETGREIMEAGSQIRQWRQASLLMKVPNLSRYSNNALRLLLYYQGDLGLSAPNDDIAIRPVMDEVIGRPSAGIVDIALVLANSRKLYVLPMVETLIGRLEFSEQDSDLLLGVLAHKWRVGQLPANLTLKLVYLIVNSKPVSGLCLKTMEKEKWFDISNFGGQHSPEAARLAERTADLIQWTGRRKFK